MPVRMYDIIKKKRDGSELTTEEINFFISGYVDGSIPDYQASALCMAIYFRGMTERETVALTDCMAHSGDTVDLSCFGELSADKHSTGGVGDKTTLIVGPIVASLGGKMAKMSGRGLGTPAAPWTSSKPFRAIARRWVWMNFSVRWRRSASP